MRSALLLMGLLVADVAFAQDDVGKAVYAAKCSACHGVGGKGDGAAAIALPKPPANMTSPDFWKTMTDERLRSIVTNGNPGGNMRAFPMKPEQLDALVAYLHTFEPKP